MRLQIQASKNERGSTMYVTLQPLFWEKLGSTYMAVAYSVFLQK